MDSENKEKRYVICPVCNKVNPAGTKFCEYCWGAALNQDTTYSQEELAEVMSKHEERADLRKKIRYGIFGGLGVVVLVLAVLFIVNYTDVMGVPGEDLNSTSLPGEWAMFRHDTLRSGSAGSEDIIPEGNLKWSFAAEGVVHSSPSVYEGMVYIGSQDYNLYALDQETGELNWKFTTGSRVDSSPAVVDGMVFFGSNDSRLYALSADSGEKVWEFKTKYPVRSSPAITDGTVYFGSDDYYLYAVDMETGKQKWRYDTDSPAGVSPVIESGVVCYGAAGGNAYILNAKSGQQRLQYKTGYTVYSSAAVDDGVVYFTTTNGLIIAVDQMARNWLWEHFFRPYWAQAWAMMTWLPECPEQSGYLWTKSLYRASTTTPVIDNGIMYLGSGSYITALDLATQEVVWEYETGDTVRSSPALAGGVIYAGSDDGKLYAVDAGSGELRWSYQTGAAVTSSPAVVDGIVYVGSDDGNIYAIE